MYFRYLLAVLSPPSSLIRRGLQSTGNSVTIDRPSACAQSSMSAWVQAELLQSPEAFAIPADPKLVRHVYGHVYGHVHRHVYRHVHRHAYGHVHRKVYRRVFRYMFRHMFRHACHPSIETAHPMAQPVCCILPAPELGLRVDRHLEHLSLKNVPFGSVGTNECWH